MTNRLRQLSLVLATRKEHATSPVLMSWISRKLASRAYWSNTHHARHDDFAWRTPKDTHANPSYASIDGMAPGRTRVSGLAGRPVGHPNRPWDGPRGGGLGGGELDGAGGPQTGGGILPAQRLTR